MKKFLFHYLNQLILIFPNFIIKINITIVEKKRKKYNIVKILQKYKLLLYNDVIF